MFKVGDKVRWYGNANPKKRKKVYTIKSINPSYLNLEGFPYSISSEEDDDEGNVIRVGNWEDYFCYAHPPKPIEEFL